jgi:uncharacterized protein YlzI (FlbEa/FlbD family)
MSRTRIVLRGKSFLLKNSIREKVDKIVPMLVFSLKSAGHEKIIKFKKKTKTLKAFSKVTFF